MNQSFINGTLSKWTALQLFQSNQFNWNRKQVCWVLVTVCLAAAPKWPIKIAFLDDLACLVRFVMQIPASCTVLSPELFRTFNSNKKIQFLHVDYRVNNSTIEKVKVKGYWWKWSTSLLLKAKIFVTSLIPVWSFDVFLFKKKKWEEEKKKQPSNLIGACIVSLYLKSYNHWTLTYFHS